MREFTMRLILASASPRRAALLRAAGFMFETLAVDIDERVQAGEPAEKYVRRLAAEKSATAIAQLKIPSEATGSVPLRNNVVIIAADTAVVVDGEILGKPRDDVHAEAMLRLLSDRRHDVMTGVSVRTCRTELGCVETTGVHCAALTQDEVARYVASWEGRDKAGGYAIQGQAARFISRIVGSYSNVVGLPIGCVTELMREALTD
jgi:septum formation protein